MHINGAYSKQAKFSFFIKEFMKLVDHLYERICIKMFVK